MRVGELLGRIGYDRHGRRLGRVVDVVVVGDAGGRLRLHELVVARRWYGRLVGSEPHRAPGPWPIPALARLLRLSSRHVPAGQVCFHPPVPGFPTDDPTDDATGLPTDDATGDPTGLPTDDATGDPTSGPVD